jgi:hypothetical protein
MVEAFLTRLFVVAPLLFAAGCMITAPEGFLNFVNAAIQEFHALESRLQGFPVSSPVSETPSPAKLRRVRAVGVLLAALALVPFALVTS